jgi:cobalt-zinc-cadmium resistance protein CzcA
MVPGVAEIVGWGGFIKQYEVNPDLAKLRYLNLSLQQVFNALERANAMPAAVTSSRANSNSSFAASVCFAQLKRSAALCLPNTAAHRFASKMSPRSKSVPCHDRASWGKTREDEIVAGIVMMRKGENPSDVLQGIKSAVAELNESVLPRGVRVAPYYDRTWLIETTLHTVFKNLAEGAMLVALILLLFLGNVRAALIVSIMIPLSLLATFIGLQWRGIPANLLSLGAMDFGIIVDGAVIVVENIFRGFRFIAVNGREKNSNARSRRPPLKWGVPLFSQCSSSSWRTSRFLRCNGRKAASSRRWHGR